MSETKFKAGDHFPDITLKNISGGEAILGQPLHGMDWQMVVVYRGRHCPLCVRYLKQIETIKQKFYDLNIDIVATSGDSEAQTHDMASKVAVTFPITYGLSIEQMKQLGLYISHPRSPQETDHPFSEPGLFVINEKGQVQVVDISNAPFARPELDALVSGLEFIRDPSNKYPIRGTYE